MKDSQFSKLSKSFLKSFVKSYDFFSFNISILSKFLQNLHLIIRVSGNNLTLLSYKHNHSLFYYLGGHLKFSFLYCWIKIFCSISLRCRFFRKRGYKVVLDYSLHGAKRFTLILFFIFFFRMNLQFMWLTSNDVNFRMILGKITSRYLKKLYLYMWCLVKTRKKYFTN